jgi:isopentenyl diphosphate isomerase/L-lactate dehydrogenase-like FMN-dependent dehydrogenase
VTWKDVDWLRSIFPGPVAIQGVLTAHDARLAAIYCRRATAGSPVWRWC